jgi:hypothetical protein
MGHLGRKPQGVKLLEGLAGSEHARRRMTLFLETLAGERMVAEACHELGIGPSRFFAQRAEWLQEALGLLEPRSPGRPPQAAPSGSLVEIEALRRRVGELEARALAAEVRAEHGRTLAGVIRPRRPGKKTARHAAHRSASAP